MNDEHTEDDGLERFGYDRPRDIPTFERELHILLGVAAAHYGHDRDTITSTFNHVADHWEETGEGAFMMSNPDTPELDDDADSKLCGDLVLTVTRYQKRPPIELGDGEPIKARDGLGRDAIVEALHNVVERIENDHYAPSI